MAKPILEVLGLTKRYDAYTAVDEISFTIGEGEIVGLLGPNGAGKTTTIQMLLDLVTPTSGNISYFGRPFPKERQYILSRINFASAYSHVQSRMTVLENMTIYAGLYEIPNSKKKITELLELLEIGSLVHELFWHLSSGQKTRVILAKALLNSPKLILMDEPTASLDPDIANKVVELIQSLQKKEGVSILYTSHNMEEVERLCDRVMFLSHGKIVAEDTPLGLTKRVGNSQLLLTFDGKQDAIVAYLSHYTHSYRFVRTHVVEIMLPEKEIPKVLFGFAKEKIWITDIAVKKPNLEDVFLSIAGGSYE
ncbi:ABC transporter ATP-binding protein [Candidatus Woesebacteria bacterium]|nr:ABC transporter ATP-binding protein [Candidatus Woesebacteria bacterium]